MATVWTIGHSTRSGQELVELLTEFGIDEVVDVRRFPGSRRLPQFGAAALAASLADAGIRYLHVPELGGRREPKPDSPNIAWRNAQFRGYADHMESPGFARGLARLSERIDAGRTALLCAEAVWWRCHRSLIADRLTCDGFTVLHVLERGRAEPHPMTRAARVVEGRLDYRGADAP